MTTTDRPGFTLAPVVETWEATVYQVSGSRTAYLVVPRTSGIGFTQAVEAGQIDGTISDYLDGPDTGRTLNQHALMLTLGLFDRLGDPQNLAAPERDPSTGRPGHARSHEDKNQQQKASSPTAPPAAVTTRRNSTRSPILIGAGVAVIALVSIGVGIAVASSGGDGRTSAAPGAPAPTVTSGDPIPGADGSASATPAAEVKVIGCALDAATGLGKATVDITNPLEEAATFQLGMSYGSTEGGSANQTDRDPFEVAPGETVTKVLLSERPVSSDVTCFWDRLRWDHGGISGTDSLTFDEEAGRYL